MDSFYFDLAKAVRWIWEHRNQPQYWEWHDLTTRNPAQDNLGLSDAVAWNIFTVLESKGLLHSFPNKKDGKDIFAFKIDLSDPKQWSEMKKDPTKYRRWFILPLKKFGKKFGVFIIWIISIVITTALTYGITRYIDIHYPKPHA